MSKLIRVAALAGLAALSCTSFVVAQHSSRHNAQNNPPATKPATPTTAPVAAPAGDAVEPLISKMRVQDYPAGHYFYASSQTTLTNIAATVQETMPKVLAAFEEDHVRPTGPSIFVYQGVNGDPNKEFTLEIGFPVPEGTKDAGDIKVRDLEPFHCASVIYSGPVAQVKDAYMQVFNEVFTAGLRPTGETREMYLYWEGPESPNNIELIMVGIEP